jgi:hypothetical protein
MFWQITAAELLGAIKSQAGVKPLIKAILSPMKVELGNTALNALIKIGKPSIAPTLALLKGEDKELLDYSKGETLKCCWSHRRRQGAGGDRQGRRDGAHRHRGVDPRSDRA